MRRYAPLEEKDMRIYILFISLIISSCDRFYHIPINGETEPLRLNFDCGSANIKLINWQGHSFDFYQDFNIKQPITLYADLIHAYFKNEKYNLFFPTLDYQNIDKVNINENQSLRIAFHIEEKVNKGDTIMVVPNGYIYCKGKKVNVDTLFLIPTQNLRAPFESKK